MLSPAYIAGFFDGEGCVNITVAGKGRQATLRLMIVNTNRDILAAVQRQCGGKLYTTYAAKKHPTWKQGWQLVLLHQEATNFLMLIEPFVRVKISQVRLGLEFQEFMKSPNRLEPFINSYGSVSRKRTQETLNKEQQFKVAMGALNLKGRQEAA